jgi:Cytochrome c554 and c-prime
MFQALPSDPTGSVVPSRSRVRGRVFARTWGLFATLALTGCGGDDTPSAKKSTYLDSATLMDPESCAGCHPNQYADWAESMHAYAADDPLFIAMNARGQREASIGTFCVNCHAPMAVRTGATTDGLNLSELPQKLKGVTCFFCHTVDEVTGSHNNPLTLATDDVMRGEYTDPVVNHAHASQGSNLHDRDRLESATLCGACHDIENQHGAHIERTFAEWQASVYSQPAVGTTCGQCHMDQSTDLELAANAPGAIPRRTHDHRFPAVDVPLTNVPGRDDLLAANQTFLDTTLQSALCVRGVGALSELRVILDNVAAGHSFPSGAAQDRRAWAEVSAYSGDELLYQSGQVPAGTSVTELDDPDVWSIRDCMLDDNSEPVDMFWAATSYETNLLPGQATFDQTDPRYYQTHVLQKYPRGDSYLSAAPDRATLSLKLAPFGLDVFDDLVASGDLTDTDAYTVAELRDALAPLSIGNDLEWTPDAAGDTFVSDGLPMACVSDTALNFRADTVPAVNHTLCAP